MKEKSAALLALIVLATAGLCYLAAYGIGADQIMGVGNIRQGLDLRGGVSILYEAQEDYNLQEGDMDAAVNLLRRRLDDRNYMDADVAKQGTRQIRVDIPGVDDPEQAREEIGAMAQLFFLDEDYNVLLTGSEVARAQKVVQTNQAGASEIVVSLEFTNTGAALFGEATSNNIGKIIYILFDNEIISDPRVQSAITDGRCVITGNFTAERAEKLVKDIRSGSLPFRLDAVHMNNVGARLGADALESSILAGFIGALLVLLFMLVVYRLNGFCADLALVIYTALLLLLLSGLRITLTLPGIAGIILSVGMAVDANVVIFERIREEISVGRSLRAALDAGYKRALPAIIDSNVTSLIVAGVLFWQGTGPVKGFAQTLAIGILVSMFTAIFVTRLITTCLMNMGIGINNPKLYGAVINEKTDPDAPKRWLPIAENRIKFIIISALTVVACVAVMVINEVNGKGALNLDVEFTGGTSLTVEIGEDFENADVETIVREITGHANPQVQRILGTNQVMIKVQSVDHETRISLLNAFTERYESSEVLEYVGVSPTVSADMQRSAVIALALAFLFMLIYITLRFRDIRMGGSTIIALLFDAVIVMLVFAVFRIPLNYAFIAVILTTLGYSINDSIIVFDRVRENRIRMRNADAAELINASVTQTLRRSIYTTVSTMVVVTALYILGVTSIKHFTLPIIFGMLYGLYSSICLLGSLWLTMGKGKK